jgi:hypothetical protein
MVLLAAMVVLPATIGGGAFLLLRSAMGDWAALPGTLLVLGIMAFEVGLTVEWLGHVFERTDPATAGIGG